MDSLLCVSLLLCLLITSGTAIEIWGVNKCKLRFRSEEALESFNKEVVLNFYEEGFTNPQNLPVAARKYLVAEGYIQHNPGAADGREGLIAFAAAFYQNSTRTSVEFIRNISADGDLVWVHEKDVAPNNNESAIVNIYRIQCGKIVEHWDVIQAITSNTAYANSHPFF